MAAAATRTRHVSGLTAAGGVGGDPSPFTARGVLRGIEAAVRHALGRDDLDGLSVAVQGVGHVGAELCALLAARGTRLTVADTNAAQLAQVCARTGANAVGRDEILQADVDVLAPCALGGAITSDVAQGLRARVVAGAANNQLGDAGAGGILRRRGITYVPDYVLNAGGIIAVAAEYLGSGSEATVLADIDAIGPRVSDLLSLAQAEGTAPELLADRRAAQIIANAR